MSGELHDKYVEDMEAIAAELIASMENMLSIIDDRKLALVNPEFAKSQAVQLIDKYHEFHNGWCNE